MVTVLSARVDVTVYDQFVMSGNSVVIKCHIPNNDLKDLLKVVTWIRDDDTPIANSVQSGMRPLKLKVL